MFAELRTIIYLSESNLYDIIPLKAKKNEKSADLIVNGNSHKYAIEVFCKISKELKEEFKTNEIIIKPSIHESDLFRYYIDTSKEKRLQFDNTSKNIHAIKKLWF